MLRPFHTVPRAQRASLRAVPATPPREPPTALPLGRGRTLLASLLRKSKSARAPKTSHPRCRTRPTLTALEDRLTPYTLSGFSWADPNVSASFIPDGTAMLGGYTSSLFATLDAIAPTATWQREFDR